MGITNKNKSAFLGMYGLALASVMAQHEESGIFNKSTPKKKKLTEEEIQELKKQQEIKRHLDNGLKPFYYGQNVVYALGKKKADNKARKLGYI